MAALRPLRKPALALAAAAGLVAWGGGPSAVAAIAAGRAPIVMGQAAIGVLGHADSPALGSGASAAAGLVAEPGKRQQHRHPGGGKAPQPAASSPLHPPFPPDHVGDTGPVLADVARARASLRSAPSTGPPSFPS